MDAGKPRGPNHPARGPQDSGPTRLCGPSRHSAHALQCQSACAFPVAPGIRNGIALRGLLPLIAGLEFGCLFGNNRAAFQCWPEMPAAIATGPRHFRFSRRTDDETPYLFCGVRRRFGNHACRPTRRHGAGTHRCRFGQRLDDLSGRDHGRGADIAPRISRGRPCQPVQPAGRRSCQCAPCS